MKKGKCKRGKAQGTVLVLARLLKLAGPSSLVALAPQNDSFYLMVLEKSQMQKCDNFDSLVLIGRDVRNPIIMYHNKYHYVYIMTNKNKTVNLQVCK